MAGPEDGAPVLLLHGFAQSRYCSRRQLPAPAAAGYRAIAFDQRGYSAGARPAGAEHYGVPAIVGDALAIMEAPDAPRFHLVGHDWGGHIAWTAASQAPERVISLAVLSRPHPAAFAQGMARDPEQAGRSRHHSALLEPAPPTPCLPPAFPDSAPCSSVRACRPRMRRPMSPPCRSPAPWKPPSTGTAPPPRLRSRDAPPVTMPTLYVWGDADATVGRAAVEGTGAFVDAPYRFEVVPGAGHFLTDQVPDLVNRLLVEHIQTHAAAGGSLTEEADGVPGATEAETISAALLALASGDHPGARLVTVDPAIRAT